MPAATLAPTYRRSIDRKLPVLASTLVLLTALVLGATAFAMLQRALVESTENRLFGAATLVTQLVQPAPRRPDSLARAEDRVLRRFALGRESRAAALTVLRRAPADTQHLYAALLDARGSVLAAWSRYGGAPAWPAAAVASGAIGGDTVSLGPIEDVDRRVASSQVHVLRDSAAGVPLGYVVETRQLSGRGASQLRRIIGANVQMLLGQPGAGVWTDFERVAPGPPVLVRRDSVLRAGDEIAATARIVGTGWMVWLSQPTHEVLAPARALLWALVPAGLLIAGVSAALMWRIARRITHPIVQLTAAAEQIARDAHALPDTGKQPVQIRDADELTRLGYAFSRMAQRVAEREALELQLRHAQKMEAVGRLAGGIAHDFNNLLTAIRSYADLMAEDMPEWDPKRGDLEEIRRAALRASSLTAQLLAFSRKQMLQPRVLDIAAVLRDVEAMLHRLLIEDIRLTVTAPADVWPVKADRGQLEQVIVNLAVNARDAMPAGGRLDIRARNEVVTDDVQTKHGPVPPGEYVAVDVRDTGVGMDAATQSRMFEPFFTTKGVGQGTGLGLSTVDGIVAQSGGFITFASAPGQGTTFTVYLPRVHEAPTHHRDSHSSAPRGHDETILLVEDEEAVRTLARRVLVRAGYRVLEATTPKDALLLAREHDRDIRLVLTDVVMPEMNGPTLVARLAEICPRAQVLYISGYTDDEVLGRGLATASAQLLQKPFSAQQLVERVRATIDAALGV